MASRNEGATDVSGCQATAMDAEAPNSFQCLVCLDLIYKPVVLACGHVSCFWCVHRAMNTLRESHCAACRRPYTHFPSVCELFHRLLWKIDHVAYAAREKEVLEEEKRADCYSPQFKDDCPTNNELVTTDRGQEVTVSDVLCVGCQQLLFRPGVLNCGHVYCGTCMINLEFENIKCQVCESIHPGEFPKVCLDLDHFLAKNFHHEYTERRNSIQVKQMQPQSELLTEKNNERRHDKSLTHVIHRGGIEYVDDDVLSKLHYGVGCDRCGMYPLFGKRYRCRDCKEAIGFDLCEACYDTRSKLPGRFNQQHTPDHTFVLDDSTLLGRILNISSSHFDAGSVEMQLEVSEQFQADQRHVDPCEELNDDDSQRTPGGPQD